MAVVAEPKQIIQFPKNVRQVSPNHRFRKIGSEEVETVTTFERKVHGTKNSEPKRHISTNREVERRTYGRDENGEIVVKIDTNPKEPVRPARPLSPVNNGEYNPQRATGLLEPLPKIDTLPLHIPRPKPSPRSWGSSPRSTLNGGGVGFVGNVNSPRSGRSSGFGGSSSARTSSPVGSVASNQSVPIKRVIRKSRLVSIHDGAPVGPYVETVSYAPAMHLPPPRTTIIPTEEAEYVDEYGSDDGYTYRAVARGPYGSRSLQFSENIEEIPANGYRHIPPTPPSGGGFYGTPAGLHRQKLAATNPNYRQRSRSSVGGRARIAPVPMRDEGAYIMQNPLFNGPYPRR